jgi:hypothetical protein
MGNPHDQALDARIRAKRFFNEAFKVVAKMQRASQIKPKRANCPKLQEPISREGDLTDA